MSKEKTEIPLQESREGRFRRVAEPRIKKTLKAIDQLASMPMQPSYSITPNDGEHVLAIINESYQKLVSNFQSAIAGTLKTSSKKEYNDINWDEELVEEGE